MSENEQQPAHISVDRALHTRAVAIKMRQWSMEHPEYGVDPDCMFLLGWLHDIGYELRPDGKMHSQAAGILLLCNGYQYGKEVYYHGAVNRSCQSKAEDLLNWADMTTGFVGQYMSMAERVQHIEERYGKDSEQAKSAEELREYLRTKGFPEK